MKQKIIIEPARITCILGIVIALLVLASIAVKVFEFETGRHNVYGLIRQFYLDNEGNVPSFFSSIILLISAVLLAIIAVSKKRVQDSYAINWAILSIIFLYLAFDEAASIHEMFSSPVMDILSRPHQGPLFHLGWTIPFTALVVVFAISYWKFLFHLPANIKAFFSIAGILYITGAIGGEILQIWYHHLYGPDNLTYCMVIMLEETLEMIGILIFIHALLKYMSINVQEVHFYIGDNE